MCFDVIGLVKKVLLLFLELLICLCNKTNTGKVRLSAPAFNLISNHDNELLILGNMIINWSTNISDHLKHERMKEFLFKSAERLQMHATLVNLPEGKNKL